MTFFLMRPSGRAPSPHWRSALPRLIVGLALGWVILGQATVSAAEPIPGRDLASIRAWLVVHNPQLRALQAEREAADARVLPAGAMPDPIFSLNLRGIDPDHPSLAPANVGSTTYAVKQTFPLWGKRALARDVARDQAQASGYERDAVELELQARAEDAYVRYWHARKAVDVIDRMIGLVRQVEELAGVRYALGMAAQQDSIRAQVEQTTLQQGRIERLAARSEAMAALNTVLGRRADAPLAEPATPPTLIVTDASLTDALARVERGSHPELQASAAMATAANRNVALERRNRYPDITVGVGSMQRGNRIEGYELMLEVQIPFQQRARREREREARLREDAALARSDATRNDLEGRLGGAWARWSSARERRQLTEKTLLPQSEANFKSAMASYQVGQVDFGTLLAALSGWQGADLARLDAQRDELLGAAAVRAIDGDFR
jgi:cobalt-zinc-cadmium efflux system outer membrane protein